MWKELEKLIDQKKNIKIRVTPELSEMVQRFCFKKSIEWGVGVGKEINHLTADKLSIHDGKWLSYFSDDGENAFLSLDAIEYDLVKDCIVNDKSEMTENILDIRIEPILGSNIKNVAKDALTIAREKNARVTFMFNGVELFAYKEMSSEDILDLFNVRLGSEINNKLRGEDYEST